MNRCCLSVAVNGRFVRSDSTRITSSCSCGRASTAPTNNSRTNNKKRFIAKLLRQADAAYQLLEPRIRSHLVKLKSDTQQRQPEVALLITLLQPRERLFFIAETRVIARN